MNRPLDPLIMRAQIALLRQTLMLVLLTVGEDGNRIADLARPNVSLRQHVERVLKDTR